MTFEHFELLQVARNTYSPEYLIYISRYTTLSEYFIRQFADQVNWDIISSNQQLSENFIREFADKVNWHNISEHQILSEDFIREFADKVDWICISGNQILSEDFIREFSDRVNWNDISHTQNLSENFMREFSNKLNWGYLSYHQILSEGFIRDFQFSVNWNYISIRQKLSENFMREFAYKINFDYISLNKKLSDLFIQDFGLKIDKEKNWLYWDKQEKMDAIKSTKLYEIDGDYIIAYKSTKKYGHSVYDCKYKYEIGKTYEANCDCNRDHENSFGLSAWTERRALDYYNQGELYKVKIHIDDVGALVQNSNKLRCFKIEIIEKVDF